MVFPWHSSPPAQGNIKSIPPGPQGQLLAAEKIGESQGFDGKNMWVFWEIPTFRG